MKLIKTVTDNYILADTTKEFHGEGYLLGATTVSDAPKLSKQNCDEIFGVVDVEKLAREWHKQQNFNSLSDNIISVGYLNMFKDGFNKAMELNKDKLFTLEDMRKAYFQGDYDALYDGAYSEKENKFIQSLQQPTEINVEIVMRPASLVYKSNLVIEELDSEGCLILKKI